jgi:hypothetical protein
VKRRPLLFIILGLLHLSEPLIKILQFKLTTNFSYQEIIGHILSISGPKQIFEFWLLFPLAGLALLSIKNWSWFLFVALQGYSIYAHQSNNAFNWPSLSQMPFFSSLLLISINCGIIIFFLLPSIRRPFFKKDVRWWEHRTRFDYSFPCTIFTENPNILKDCKILNLSLSGAFLETKEVIADGTVLTINITFGSQHITLKALKISTHAFQSNIGIGVQFRYKNIWQQWLMSRVLKKVSKALKNKNPSSVPT